MEQSTVSDTATKVGEFAQTNVQDKLDQGKAMLQDAKAGAEDAMNKASSVARQVGNQASQAASSLYEQGTNAGGYVSRYAAEQPWTALLLAAAVGYGLAYLIHRP